MKARLLKGYLEYPPGTIVDFPLPITIELIKRGVAVELKNDPDGDGKSEGGHKGEKKAFSRPPEGKRQRR